MKRGLLMSFDCNETLQLEKNIGAITIRITTNFESDIRDLCDKLDILSNELERRETEKKRLAWRKEVLPSVYHALTKVTKHYHLKDNDFLKTGINRDYPRVILSLLRNFDECMGATEVSKEWGGINTGIVSRVFRGSKESTRMYKYHFEEYEKGRYRFSTQGFDYALTYGIPEIVGDSFSEKEDICIV